jgi:hypothetical protein
MWVVAGSLDFGVITFGIRSRWFLDTGGTLPARERCAKPVVRRLDMAHARFTPGMLSADNAEPSSNSVNPPPGAQLLALTLRPPFDPGPGRRDFEPRIREFLHRSRRPATVPVSPMPHERRSLPPLFSLPPTKSSVSRSPWRPATGTGMITPRIDAAASYHFSVIPAMAAPGPFRAHQCDVPLVDCQK